MKKVILAITVLLIIITAGILENEFVNRTFDELDGRLTSLENLIKAEDESAVDEVKELTKWWEKRRNYLEMLAFSPDVRAFSVALAETDGSLQCGDFDNSLSKCQSLLVMSNNLRRLLDFNVEDIV